MSVEPCLCILVFARAPVPGKAKTRLAAAIGARQAAVLQQRMTQQVLSTACRASNGPVALWCTPSTRHPFFRACREQFGLTLHRQHGGDLGARLIAAHNRAFRRYARVLVIGTDCPILDLHTLRAAAADLDRNDAVLVPAEDGGYVLLGLARPCAEAFVDIDWSGPQVSAQTLERFRAAGVTCRVRNALWDVDRPQDLVRLARLMPHLTAGLMPLPQSRQGSRSTKGRCAGTASAEKGARVRAKE
jgi:rSAM/selenodomain-associated transferase 1